MKIAKHIPNAITCGNLLCGCLAIVKAFEGDLVWAAYLVGIAAVLDFFDGFAARLLKVSSPIGKDLDSLADMVTFGVVPGVVMYHLMYNSLYADYSGLNIQYQLDPDSTYSYLPYIAFVIPVFSAIRLAKFNNDPRQTDSFIGVPTPAVAIFICSLPLILSQAAADFIWILNPTLLAVSSLLLSILLVSEIPLFSLKFKKKGWSGNQLRYVFLAVAVVLLLGFGFLAIPVVILLYILLSIVNNIFFKAKV